LADLLDRAQTAENEADAQARTTGAAARDTQECLVSIEEKACQLEVIEARVLEVTRLEERVQELEASVRATQERLEASDVRARDAEVAVKSARKKAELADSTWHQDSALLSSPWIRWRSLRPRSSLVGRRTSNGRIRC
jgi:predicted nuclease with TOPRIM domain